MIHNFGGNPSVDRFIFRVWRSAVPTDYVFIFADVNLSTGWHHVAGIWDNEYSSSWDHFAIYLDGVRIAASINSYEMTPGLINATSAFDVGGNGSTSTVGGGVDEVRVSKALRYTGASYSVPTGPFVADADAVGLWHFAESSGSSFADSSSYGNNLTGSNGATTCAGRPPTPRCRGWSRRWGD